jgi:predicted DNA-binding transcriptional regulator YafY
MTVQFDVDDLNWATGWIISWGHLAKALEPPELIHRVREAAQEVLKCYDEN